jgi:hypothetical protein
MVNRYNIIGRLVEDEMNMVRCMGLEEMDDYVSTLIYTLLDKTKSDEELVVLDNQLLVMEQLNNVS